VHYLVLCNDNVLSGILAELFGGDVFHKDFLSGIFVQCVVKIVAMRTLCLEYFKATKSAWSRYLQ